jgi:hypothetical protein
VTVSNQHALTLLGLGVVLDNKTVRLTRKRHLSVHRVLLAQIVKRLTVDLAALEILVLSLDGPQLGIDPVATAILAAIDGTADGQTTLSVVPPLDRRTVLFTRKGSNARDDTTDVVETQTVLGRLLTAALVIKQQTAKRLIATQVTARTGRRVVVIVVVRDRRLGAVADTTNIVTACRRRTHGSAHGRTCAL